MLIIRRFSHRHSRTFFISNSKRENPLNECEKSVDTNLYKKYGNPILVCETPFQNCFVNKYGNIQRDNPLNECEKPFENCISKKTVNLSKYRKK